MLCGTFYCWLQKHYVTSSSVSPSVHRDAHRNISAPASPVHTESRRFGSHGSGGDTLHRQQPSLPHAENIRSSASDNVAIRYADRRPDAQRDSGYSDRSRVDHDYSDFAYVRASEVNHPKMRDMALDYRAGSGRGAAVVPDGTYSHPHWPDHQVERSHLNSHRQMDPNLYHIASNRTMSYSSSDELHSALPVTAAATTSRFLDPAPHWPTRRGSLEGPYQRPNGDSSNTKLSGGCMYVGSSPHEKNPPDRTYDAMPRRLASPPVHYETPPHVRAAAADVSCDSVELSPIDPVPVVLRGQNYVEVSKPFEMADVYKYSARMRLAVADGTGDRMTSLRSSSSPHLTNHTRGPQHQDIRPAYIAPSTQYFPTRHFRKPVFD